MRTRATKSLSSALPQKHLWTNLLTPEDISRIEAVRTDIREGRGYTAREVRRSIDTMDE